MKPPSNKRRKLNTVAVEEVKFDDSARADYLTGFHKRKLQRIKHAQDQAAKKEREERLEMREELRKQRKVDLENHVASVHAIFKEMNKRTGRAEDEEDSTSEGESGVDGEWEGFEDKPEISRQDQEYIDEDRYATVTVEAVNIDRDGFVTQRDDESGSEAGDTAGPAAGKLAGEGKKRVWTKEKPKKPAAKKGIKKKKFRYESKQERKVTRAKERSKNSRQAKERREKDT